MARKKRKHVCECCERELTDENEEVGLIFSDVALGAVADTGELDILDATIICSHCSIHAVKTGGWGILIKERRRQT